MFPYKIALLDHAGFDWDSHSSRRDFVGHICSLKGSIVANSDKKQFIGSKSLQKYDPGLYGWTRSCRNKILNPDESSYKITDDEIGQLLAIPQFRAFVFAEIKTSSDATKPRRSTRVTYALNKRTFRNSNR